MDEYNPFNAGLAFLMTTFFPWKVGSPGLVYFSATALSSGTSLHARVHGSELYSSVPLIACFKRKEGPQMKPSLIWIQFYSKVRISKLAMIGYPILTIEATQKRSRSFALRIPIYKKRLQIHKINLRVRQGRESWNALHFCGVYTKHFHFSAISNCFHFSQMGKNSLPCTTGSTVHSSAAQSRFFFCRETSVVICLVLLHSKNT